MKNEELFIIKLLEEQGIKTQKYFGEFSNTENLNFDLNQSPLVFVDYIGSKPKNFISDSHSFNLYIVHISHLKDQNNETLKHPELYKILQEMKDTLNLKAIKDKRIKFEERKKIFDKRIKNDYLTVFLQNLIVS